MPRATATVSFQAIELKGSLLPASLLEQVARLQAPMQKEADYGLAKGERLREQIDAAWVRLKEIWEEYRDLRERAAQSAAGLHLAQRLLKEVLGWSDLQPCCGWQHGDSHFPITHRAFEGSVPLILRGIPADQLDKGSSAFGQEGRRRSAHSCLQECLNADDSANWGLLLSGDRLRLLHDNPSLVKPAYLQVDLELLVEGELFDEFASLWLLLHASRFRHPQTGGCVLDSWKEQAQEAGERVLGQLRHGVQQALEALGNGLLQHPDNDALRAQLASGALSGAELHRQLLRLVYRFLFLFTAEDRDLLFPRTISQDDARRRIYREGYNVGRLRELAIRRSASEGPYGDLWQTQKLVFLQLRQSSSPLGLPGLGGLFNAPQCQALEACELGNRYLLRAMRAIGWFQATGTLTRVNYRDLNTEELGSVYEGLLELHPQLERNGGSWLLNYGGGAGSDRKTTGSYYTPDQLVQLLIVSALLPVIADRLSKATTREEKEAALLAIRVLDPACGSGHFLLAAARRLALELARIRAEDEEPSEELRQQCLRDVVAHCIYGVDKNPMAVELCKVALWIEAIEPGKPLSFLDAHIQCGDSLVGVFDPKVLEQGIPDEAYKQLTGDDKTVCTSLRKDNASFRKAGQKGTLQGTLNLEASPPISHSQQRLKEIEAMPETTLAEGEAKRGAYEAWEQQQTSDPQTLAADLYTAAFFLSKPKDCRAKIPTTQHLLLLQIGQEIPGELEQAVDQATRDFQFFHWHLRFGEVMKTGGFDCVLGNPPWEVLEEEEKKFFASRNKEIADAPGARRKALIASLEAFNPHLFGDWQEFSREREAFKEFHRIHPALALSSYKKLNLYASFLELASALSRGDGTAGLIIQGGLLSDESRSRLSSHLMRSSRIRAYYEFNNTNGIFRDIHRQQSFAVITLLGREKKVDPFILAFGCESIDDIADPVKLIQLNPRDMELMSPIDGTVPKARNAAELGLIAHIYRRVPPFCSIQASKGMGPATIFNITTANAGMDLLRPDESFADTRLVFASRVSDNWVPLMEGKYVANYSCRNSTFKGCSMEEILKGSSKRVPSGEDGRSGEPAMPRWWMRSEQVSERIRQLGIKTRWMLGFCDVTNSENQRTALCSFLPTTAASHTLWIFTGEISFEHAAMLCACINSLAFDFIAKRRVSSRHLTKAIFQQLPILPAGFGTYKCTWEDIPLAAWLASRVCSIYRNVPEVSLPANATALASELPPEIAQAEIDACMLAIFLANKESSFEQLVLDEKLLQEARLVHIPLILSVFSSLRDAERDSYGEYRTQRLVLEAWDRLFGGD